MAGLVFGFCVWNGWLHYWEVSWEKQMNKCRECKHHMEVPGNWHISCINPDQNMTGNPHGISKGWFMYPLLFDPIWSTKKCDNFESSVSHPVSPAVSE